MKKVIQIIILVLLVLGTVGILKLRADVSARQQVDLEDLDKAQSTQSPSPSPAATPQPTPVPTPEPTPEYFTISCIGDNTLWASQNFENNVVGLPLTVGDDYSYPYKNTADYFKDDELTLANLECSFSDKRLPASMEAQFNFLAKPEYADILINGSVEFVTMANNHTMDFNEAGVEKTKEVLESYGIPYGTEGQSQIITTKNGLKVGIYTSGTDLRPDNYKDKAIAALQDMKSQGADLLVCMLHWGRELYYTPENYQVNFAHELVDAGANLIYASHPHCLQPIEQYNGGLILYSLGNWVFGGSTRPSDPDTAIVQVSVKRDVDGSVTIDGFKAIPCCVSSKIDSAQVKADNYNDYCPTPYEEGSEAYLRVMSKLDGTYEPSSQGRDYSDYYASWG